MKHNEISELLRHIEEVAQNDPEALASLIAMTKRASPAFYNGLLGYDEEIRREAVIVMPSLSEVTCAQLTLFDNWKNTKGVKPSRKKGQSGARAERFKAQLELWTTAPNVDVTSRTQAIKLTFHLMNGASRIEKMADYTNPIKAKGGFVLEKGEFQSPEWEAYATSLLSMPEDALCGPGFTTKLKGTNFVCNAAAMINATDAEERPDDLSMIVTMPCGGHIAFHSFTDTYAGRVALNGAAVRISRLALPTHHPAWRTGVLPSPLRTDAIPEAVELSNDEILTVDDMPF